MKLATRLSGALRIGLVIAAGVLVALPAAARETGEAYTVTGIADSYRPAAISLGETLLTPRLTLAGRMEATDDHPVDRDDSVFASPTAIDVTIRAGLTWNAMRELDPIFVVADFELDVVTGFLNDDPALAGESMPNAGGTDTLNIRNANLLLSYQGNLILKGGIMTSHWGLGLVANDGARFWRPGSATFTDPRGGDRVLRGQLTYKTSGEDYFAISGAFDSVIDDDVLRDDDAIQGILAVLVKQGDTKAGLYGVVRRQEAPDGDELNAYVVDAYAETRFELDRNVTLSLATEWALIFGDTQLAPTTDFPEHDILQLGGVVRAGVDAGSWGGVVDFVYASGDRNFDDDQQNAFKADINFDQGFILFPQILGAQSGRATVTAANLDLVGKPSEDLDRFPTEGKVSNTVSIFPRVWVRPLRGLEIYGGALFAFAESEPADPFNSRLGGGPPRNALDRKSGDFLGTELDMGLRFTTLFNGSELSLGVEGGVFFAGDGLRGKGAALDNAILAGRALVHYRL